jgi:ubiquinone/menaquinone biosynthesis C-methylase UbiE
MERLSCTSTVSYNATEAAIHMARYQLAVPYCKGKSVLDVACGEGYGAFALLQLGAASVDGVDNSPEAVKNAEALFSRPKAKFHLHDAEQIDQLFPDRRFDIIVCLETIEHLKDPTRFLRALQKVAAENATIIITCPNDHWYYADGQSNPFHIRKYSFEAFRDLTTRVLGSASSWAYGAPVVGFGAVADELVAGRDQLAGQLTMLEFRSQAAAILMPPRGFAQVGPRNCSYFVGIWGGDTARVYTSAVVPISMDDYANLVSWESARLSPRRLAELENERSALVADKARLEQQHEASDAQHARQEADYRQQFASLTQQADELQSQRATLLSEKTLLQQQYDEAQSERVRLEAECRGQVDKLDEIEKERDRYRLQAFALAKEFDLISVQTRKIRTERDEHLATLAAVRSESESVRDQLRTRQADLDAKDAELAAGRDELEGVCRRLAEAEVEFARTRQELETSRAELADSRQQALALAAHLEELRALLAAREGLRYLTRATAGGYYRRIAFNTIVRPARVIRPFLPPPALAAARRLARMFHLAG